MCECRRMYCLRALLWCEWVYECLYACVVRGRCAGRTGNENLRSRKRASSGGAHGVNRTRANTYQWGVLMDGLGLGLVSVIGW